MAAELIASGDLTVKVNHDSKKDILGRSFEKMTANLRTLITSVKITAVKMAEGSEQLSQATESLSQGASEQAASFEQITSSMVEIGSQTRSNADNAGHAKQLAAQARGYAENGMQEMQEMIDAMEEINKSSKSIAKIIKNIDEIAFQTNLLSLNAAVEAARAGRHGKGFAVVAGEVRNLAARSAKAAKETEELIEGTVNRIKKGNQIAGQTAHALKKITESAINASELIAEIAAATDEQANGIAQINQGLDQTEQVTQQNTASAEELASSAVSFSNQAETLQKLLSQFKL
ncbi:Methyl-accepting chemotaxis protein domain-containing protein [Desulfonema limicola]|uniref:Methyl-accepting chemotaxis protein domain-containing protein n=2 Tax=Desulfonema limicola TaxID=45656 RepID=A0A975B9A0_9BACT|nr:Methyl-accepting chemotaxis protein domain-containing protein [Desulfonema limicola]